MSRVVALSGWKQSGKDTTGLYLVENYGFKRFSFADVLKDMVAEQYDVERSWLDNPDYKEAPLSQYPVNPQDGFSRMICDFMQKEFKHNEEGSLCWTPRALAILEGSIKRSVNSSYWVQRVVNSILKSSETGFVITDLRYKSEARQLQEAFGDALITVRLNRFEDSPSSDPSERDLDDHIFDHILDNTQDLDYLNNNIKNLMENQDG